MMLVSFLKIGGLRVKMEGKWKWVSHFRVSTI
jgi:hypothetical protein